MIQMDKWIIFTGGADIHPGGFDKDELKGCGVICADSGIKQLNILNDAGFNILPDIILGDMDSFDEKCAIKAFPTAYYLPFPPEKDYTDTQLALVTALKNGAKSVLLIGGTGNRVDHYLANLALLRYASENGTELTLSDGKNVIRHVSGGMITLSRDDRFKYFSILPDGEPLRGVTIKGAKYNLWDATVDRDMPISVSNEIVEEKCVIIVIKGSFFIALCSD